jgi:hypothetical protein
LGSLGTGASNAGKGLVHGIANTGKAGTDVVGLSNDYYLLILQS